MAVPLAKNVVEEGRRDIGRAALGPKAVLPDKERVLKDLVPGVAHSDLDAPDDGTQRAGFLPSEHDMDMVVRRAGGEHLTAVRERDPADR